MENTEIPTNSTKTINRVTYTFTANSTDGLKSDTTNTNQSTLLRKASSDRVIVEQPLQITLSWLSQGKVHNKVFTITMRTPGHDQLLIIGLLHSEGVIKELSDIEQVNIASADVRAEGWKNEWLVEFSAGITPDLSSLDRYIMSYSSCGLCGTTSLKNLQLKTDINLSFPEHKNTLKPASLLSLSNKMRSGQGLFDETGGVHGAALFELTPNNSAARKDEPQCTEQREQKLTMQQVFEDIGRHNAVDKVIGAMLTNNFDHQAKHDDVKIQHALSQPQRLQVLVVSGRISFEIVQKTIMAGINVLVAVGAPSDLAIQAAKQFDLTLIGFVSDKGFNVYHGDWRLGC